MQRFFQALFWSICRLISFLRYRVCIVGGEKLRDLRGPTLVMPNHPAYIDPPLVLTHLRIKGGIRPTVHAMNYRNPVLYPLMRLVDALEVPDLSEHSQDAREQTLSMIDAVVSGLERGENFLLYPSGRAQRRGLEEIGANRAAAEVLTRCPAANIVLVRTRGIFGSSFSYAYTGHAPNLSRCVLRVFGWGIANLLLLAPRRKVTMTVEVIDRNSLPGLSREKLNRFLEEWYNHNGPEAPSYVPYHYLFGPREHRFPDMAAAAEVDLSKVRPATIQAVKVLIEEHLGRPLDSDAERPETPLGQIGLDSLDRMDIALKIEDRFGFHSDQVAETLGGLWALAEGLLTGSGDGVPPVPKAWHEPPSTTEPTVALADTMSEALVRRVFRHPDDVAVADRISGVLSYRRLLVGTRLLGRRLGRLPGDAIGVMLPSSVAADLVFFALHQAGKLPVMLNWTTGPGNLAHAVETLGIRRVVTSRRLIDRLGIEVRGADYVFLEDLRSGIGKIEALCALLATYLFRGRLLRSVPRPDPDQPAVVLFTSGSESTPKAVPLSHRNLLTNVRASLTVLQATRADALLGFLPPFHSFGLMGNVIAPTLAGVRLVHCPDPTDAAGLVRAVADYRATLMVTTPTFLSYMFGVAQPEDLDSLRIIITGAEKCPEAVFARARQMAPHATILEGYGITECSPVVSGNRPEHVKPGTVGPPVDGVEVCLVDPESREPLPAVGTGLLLVHGPSVFAGYLNYDGPDPFVEVHGKRWYVTGDLVEIDEEGYIHFRGRLKRFLKVGGEMVSLPALEEPFGGRYPPTDKGPQVAVEGIETPGSRWIVLFSTQDIPLRQANAILAEAGFRGVMRLDEVVRLDAIPILGTGKTDYKVLRRMVTDRVHAAARPSAG
jgi:acyl-CoA synthetase (AMP-forming)/AMP-acid ligase II/1-acyl-sn-glycerol-3-phosphate acyltransferase/acyl carrier protein